MTTREPDQYTSADDDAWDAGEWVEVDDPATDGDHGWHDAVEDEWGRVYDDRADDYVAVPGETSRSRRVLWVLGGIGAFLVIVAGGFVWWVNQQIDPPGPPGGKVSFEVPEGGTITDLAGDLEELGVISNSLVFRFYARQENFEAVQAGTYEDLRTNSAMGDVIEVLADGPAAPPPAAEVTVVPGLRLTEVVPVLTANLPEFDDSELAAALAAARSVYMPADSTNLEGFLYPDTYRIEDGDEADEAVLINQMTARFDEMAAAAGIDESAARVGLTPYEVVIVASIIEREAQKPEDQAKVAQVIYNRLAQGMNLEIDATLLYGIGHKETLTQSDLETDTPYNTRLYAGLPPTPIAMPGQGAIEAALNPEPGSWLFYVLADEDGGHFFTDDYDEFLRVAQESRDAGIFE